MWLTSVVIEGFKSYGQRTVIEGFDQHFNAITGLNGSGKSNVLDAICFVLGIQNLNQVRASSIQDLVYKQGQAGVTKATVTLNFNNESKKDSPVGYEAYDEISITRQVVIGGKNKYLINGTLAQPTRVQNLFHSVQLNVNNPHFLIMQGMITKVLNMKPPEILAMIEEAAGTRMFETKKVAALKTIEKKDTKLKQLNEILAQDIAPQLERLGNERHNFLQYQNNKMEAERYGRLLIAHDYAKAEETLRKCNDEHKALTDEMEALKGDIKKYDAQIEDAKVALSALERKRDAEMGGALQELETKSADISKELVKANTMWQHKKDAVDSEKKAKAALEKSIAEVKANITAAQKNRDAATSRLAKLEAESEAATAELESAQRRVHGFSMATSKDGHLKTQTDAIMDAQAEADAAKAAAQQCDMRVAHLEGDVEKRRKQVKSGEKEHGKLQAELKAAEAAVSDLERQLAAVDSDPAKMAKLASALKQEEAKAATLKDKMDALNARLGSLDFSYADPEPKFDRSRVKGLVANLVSVKDAAASTALEVAAGGKLFNVVVDTEATGKALIANGKLKKRVTIIPLNKIAPHVLSDAQTRAAEKEAKDAGCPGAVRPALSLVGYDDEVAAAMQYVFGPSFVCDGLDLARKVTFNKAVQARTVTLDGDVFDPSGTLTGGSREKNASTVLADLAALREASEELAKVEARIEQLRKEHAKAKQAAADVERLSSARELKQHEHKLLEQRMASSAHGRLVLELAEMEATVARERSAAAEAREREKRALARLASIQAEMGGAAKSRESELKALEGQLEKMKSRAASTTEATRAARDELTAISLELAAMEGEMASLKEQLAQAEAAAAQAVEEERAMAAVVEKKKAAYEQSCDELAKKREKLNATDKEISGAIARRDKCSKNMSDAELALKKAEHSLTRLVKDRKDASRVVEGLGSKHAWIATEKQFFGKQGTAYDFGAVDAEEARKKLARLEEQQAKLSKTINMKVMAMFERADQEYRDLMNKKRIVEKDKQKIEDAITELDAKKNEALKKTYTQVNRDFGSIFSTLLPGAKAKLAAPEGQTELDGLEVKVAFGDVWKESLTELSGGQRSLVALSLILSLLLFKPAPMYILDEVDAALDLSHTQNIGTMLRTHFSQSQFIVVSLKEGMFNNANVLFKTRFVDGVSTVTRTVQASSADENAPSGKNAHKRQKTAAAPSAAGKGKALAQVN